MKELLYKQPYWTEDQTKSINSFRNPNDRLYEVDSWGELKFDQLIKANQSETSLSKIYHDVLMPQSKFIMPETIKPMKGCTCAAVKSANNHPMVGKNYDWWKDDDFCLVVKTHGGKYQTIGTTSSHFFSVTNKFKMNLEIAERFAYAPYYVFDGMNDQGLVISTLITHGDAVKQEEPGKLYLSTKLIPQLLLTSCKTVDECITLLKKYNVVSYAAKEKHDYDYHWIIADKTGKRICLEYIDSKMVIYTNRICEIDFNWENGAAKCLSISDDPKNEFIIATNFYLALDNPKCKQPIDPKTGLYTCSDYGWFRYTRILEDLRLVPHPDKRQLWLMLKNARYELRDIDTSCYWRNKGTPWTTREQWDGLTTFSSVFDCLEPGMELCIYENFDKVYKYKI